jgi:hypothetical protein
MAEAESGDTPDGGGDAAPPPCAVHWWEDHPWEDHPPARRYYVAERAEVAKQQNMVDAAQRMAADAWMAVEDMRRARVRLAEIEKEKVTWWRPEPICAVSCVSTPLKAPVGI